MCLIFSTKLSCGPLRLGDKAVHPLSEGAVLCIAVLARRIKADRTIGYTSPNRLEASNEISLAKDLTTVRFAARVDQ